MARVSAEKRGGKQIQEAKPAAVEMLGVPLWGCRSSLLLPHFAVALDPGVSACNYRVM